MSIASEISRLQTAKADLKTAITAKGGSLTTETLDDYASAVDAITTMPDFRNTGDVTFSGATTRESDSTTSIAAGASTTRYYTINKYPGDLGGGLTVSGYSVLWCAFICGQASYTPKYWHRGVLLPGSSQFFSTNDGLEITYELDSASTYWRIKASVYNPQATSKRCDTSNLPYAAVYGAEAK